MIEVKDIGSNKSVEILSLSGKVLCALVILLKVLMFRGAIWCL